MYSKVSRETSFDKYSVFRSNNFDDSVLSLMSDLDHEFLLGLLEQSRPKKVLEIGVPRGGTSVCILSWINQLGLSDTRMYSVDIDESDLCGHLIQDAQNSLPNIANHRLYKGAAISEVIEQIGDRIDFVIIDTLHLVPCEILDFLSCYPFLTGNAIVVLHDIGKNLRDRCTSEASKLLFDTVTAKKFWNWNGEEYTNIAAFQISEDTNKYILDVVSSLSLSWNYNPGDKILRSVGKIIQKYYPSEAYGLFTKLCLQNQNYVQYKSRKMGKILFEVLRSIANGKRVFLYGSGKMTERILSYGNEAVPFIDGIIVSDGQTHKQSTCGIPIRCLSEVDLDGERDIVIITLTNWNLRNEIMKVLADKGIKNSAIDLLNDDEMFELSSLLLS